MTTAARPPAPPYRGEGPHELWHVSEDPDLTVLEPHVPATNPSAAPAVWAVDTRHLPLYWFPRDCPRGCVWAAPATTAQDRRRFGLAAGVRRTHAIQSDWLDAMRATRLFLYRLPPDDFLPDPLVGGCWRSRTTVVVDPPVVVEDLVAMHEGAGITVAVVDDLAAWWAEVIGSTLEFSGMRLANLDDPPASRD